MRTTNHAGSSINTAILSGQMLASIEFRSVILDDDAILQLFALDLIEFLCLDDVLEAALVPVALQLIQQMKFMRF